MSTDLEPENAAPAETVPVPGGAIERKPGETLEEFGRRADELRLAARRGHDGHVVSWRAHMERCYDVPLSEHRRVGFRGTNPQRHPWFTNGANGPVGRVFPPEGQA